MTPIDFAHRFIGDFKQKGDEIIATHCPFCHGGSHGDKYSFALNTVNQTFNCKRGSCGKQGHFSQLCREFGVEMENEYTPKQKSYKKPEKQPRPAGETAMEYMKRRGLSKETIEAYRIGADEDGNIQFPYYTDKGEHVFNKFRLPRKLDKGDRKAWRETDTMPVLFGMWRCDSSKPLCIFEGEFDCMSGHEAGIPNCVSVPSGAEDFTWIDTCWDFLQRFDAIYLYGDNDQAGREMVRRLAVKLSDKRVCIVNHEFKDANELLYRRGKDAVKAAWDAAEEVPVAGLINLAEVMPLDTRDMKAVNTSIVQLNRMIGGFIYGDVSVWTGKRGEGKSTLLSQLMLDAIQDGKKVCAYSGELRADRYQYWTDLQAAGKSIVQSYHEPIRDRVVYYTPQAIRDKIHAWYNGKYWMYDNIAAANSDEEITILNRFEMAAKRYDCRVFLVDNLMTADYGKTTEKDYYRQQSRFVGQLVAFANRHNVHVHLVAHPRKVSGEISNDDVSGSGDITNRAANVITISKSNDEQQPAIKLEIIKNRWEGTCGSIALNYCNVSRRLYSRDTGNTVLYGWSDLPTDNWTDITENDPNSPF